MTNSAEYVEAAQWTAAEWMLLTKSYKSSVIISILQMRKVRLRNLSKMMDMIYGRAWANVLTCYSEGPLGW